MSEHTLTMVEADLIALETALTTARQTLSSEFATTRSRVASELVDWQVGTSSRDAQLDFDRRLNLRVDKVAEALRKVSTAVTQLREAAHEAEVRNVAIVD